MLKHSSLKEYTCHIVESSKSHQENTLGLMHQLILNLMLTILREKAQKSVCVCVCLSIYRGSILVQLLRFWALNPRVGCSIPTWPWALLL